MSQPIILGLVGEMAAGKTTVTNYLKEKHGAVTFRFSDMLRDILQRIHVEPLRNNLQSLSTFLRQTYGEDIMSKTIALDVQKVSVPLIITEGIRRPTDIVYLKKLPGFYVIAINANERARFERITQRSENPDDQKKTWKQFQLDGKQESEQKIKEIAAEANFKIDNNSIIPKLYEQIDFILTKIGYENKN